MPAARGAEAEVPVWVSVQSLCRSALVWGVSGERNVGEHVRHVILALGVNPTEGCICSDQEAQLMWFPTSSSEPQADVCHLLIFYLPLLYMQLVYNSGIRMPFLGMKSSHCEFFFFSLLRFPNETLSVKKGLFQNHCESCWPINHQVHCVWPGIFRNFASCPIPHCLQIDICLPLQQKEVVLILATWTTCAKPVECVLLALTVDVFWWPGVSIIFLLSKWWVFQMKVC